MDDYSSVKPPIKPSVKPLPEALKRLRKFSRRWLNPITLRFAGRWFFGVIDHTGRRSSKAYQTPVFAHPTAVGGGFIVPLTYGEHTDWYQNLRVSGGKILHRGIVYTIHEVQMVDQGAAMVFFPPVWRWIFRWIGLQQFLILKVRTGDL
ncbi:MAG TPA: hypothetical protein VHL11_03880 [Phototrophicaceae bacterium]|jgi:deazaflavin-dependent oxidoreductase (nitroreductase family)|nr:hypothetical protein [Phototrophicaceae bacterium]